MKARAKEGVREPARSVSKEKAPRGGDGGERRPAGWTVASGPGGRAPPSIRAAAGAELQSKAGGGETAPFLGTLTGTLRRRGRARHCRLPWLPLLARRLGRLCGAGARGRGDVRVNRKCCGRAERAPRALSSERPAAASGRRPPLPTDRSHENSSSPSSLSKLGGQLELAGNFQHCTGHLERSAKAAHARLAPGPAATEHRERALARRVQATRPTRAASTHRQGSGEPALRDLRGDIYIGRTL